MEKDNQFLKDLKTFQPEQVLGLARVCGIKLLASTELKDGHAQPKDGAQIVREILEIYANSNRAERRWLAQIVHDSVKRKK